MEGPPLKVVAEELSFLAGEQIISASGNARIEKERARYKLRRLRTNWSKPYLR